MKHEPDLPATRADSSLGKRQAGPESMRTLRVHVETSRSAVVGGAVPIKLVVSNIGRTRIDVLQAGNAPAYDLTITGKAGRVVWQRLPPDAFLTTAGLLYSLAPGQRHDLETIVWDQRDLRGHPIEPGHYEIHGVFYGGVAYSGRSEMQTDTVSLTVER